MNKVLLICGAKQSGKSSLANFIAGYFLNRADIIEQFGLTTDGSLEVKIKYIDPHTNKEQVSRELALLDLNRKDDEFLRFAQHNIWPFVKLYSFANKLKWICCDLFGCNVDGIFGTDEQRNKFTTIKWANMQNLFPIAQPSSNEFMTHREFMQVLGTNIFRTIDTNCHVRSCLNDIYEGNSNLSIITDGRFRNEVEACIDIGAKRIRLQRNLFKDSHTSELEILKLPTEMFHLDLYNSNMTLDEQNRAVFQAMKEWGWVEGSL